MPIVRRRVYIDRSLTRKGRIEAWLSYSIFVAGVMLVLCLLICLPDVVFMIATNLLPAPLAARFGIVRDPTNFVTTLSEILAVIAGVYLLLVLCLKSSTRHPTR